MQVNAQKEGCTPAKKQRPPRPEDRIEDSTSSAGIQPIETPTVVKTFPRGKGQQNPRELKTQTAQELLDQPLAPIVWLVKQMITVGATLIVGDPKVGKSWIALLLALCVSLGKPFLEHETRESGVLYLCLEDTYKRIQKRLFRLTDVANDNLHVAISACRFNEGLIDQMEGFLAKKPSTRLIIIDTLQTIRNPSSNNAYADDYYVVGALKQFADEHDLSIVLIHHTNKLNSQSNVFARISGSNGIMGAADTIMMLTKPNICSSEAFLTITGRDVNMTECKLEFENFSWKLIEQISESEMEERSTPPEVLSVLGFMSDKERWEGTASQLLEEARIADLVKRNVISKRLNEHRDFLRRRGVEYSFRRTSSSRVITLTKIKPEAEN